MAGSPFSTGDNPLGISIAPGSDRLYTADNGPDSVSAFAMAADGSLGPVPGSPFPAGGGARDLSVTPDGGRLYAVNSSAGTISAYTVGADGSLSTLSGSPFPGGDSPSGIAITPNQGPAASFGAGPPKPGAPASFNAAASSDPDGTVARYDWDFGDGTTLANGGPTPTHSYATPGTYVAKLTVTDNEGCSTTRIFTGQTAYCNPSAGPTASVEVVAADFSLGRLKRNKDKGTAKLPVTVSGPGTLVLAGKGIKRRSKQLSRAGIAQFRVTPTGKLDDKLEDEGKAKIKLKVAFTPTGGLAARQTKRGKLVER